MPAPLGQLNSVSFVAPPRSVHSLACRAAAGDDLSAKNAVQNTEGALNEIDAMVGSAVVEEISVIDGLDVPGENGVMDAEGNLTRGSAEPGRTAG